MSLVIQRETTEYLYVGVTGDEPSDSVEVAVLLPGARPSDGDWHPAVLVNDQHSLWADASGSGLTGNYYIARLIGPWNNDLDPGQGDFQVWIRLTDTDERPVRIAPVALEVA